MAEFPSTHWSVIGRARDLDPEVRREALEDFLIRYWRPLQAHLMRKRGLSAQKAEETIQDFVEDKIVARELLRAADARRGKLRSLLLTALDRFVIDQYRLAKPHELASKGAGEIEHVPSRTESDVFDVEWGRTVLNETLTRMRKECESADRLTVWELFECRILGPTLAGEAAPRYGEIIRRFGFDSPKQASNALMNAKRMFKRLLRAVVAEYVDEDDVDRELQELKTVLSSCG